LTRNKGLAFAIEATAQLQQRGFACDYYILGEGEERRELVERARALNVSDHVHLLGFVTNAVSYLKAFDIFVLPSVKEGSPYTLLESASAGLPIVATTAVDKDIASVRVEARDSRALADVIPDLLKSTARTHPSRSSLAEMIRHTILLY